MRVIDSHFHWRPRKLYDQLSRSTGYPRAEPNDKGGYNYWRREGAPSGSIGAEWFDLDRQLEHMDSLGHDMGVVCSTGPFSVHFSYVSPEQGRDQATLWNEEMARVQREYAGKVWASAAVPLVDTQIAIDVLNHAVTNLGLIGVNVPGSVGSDPRIDAERLEPFYDRVEQLGIPLFLHPTDAIFQDMLDGYDGALHLSLGRVIEVSVAAYRLVLSGVMERHPNLKIFMSHTGGALPYQAGRMDKNSKAAKLPQPPSTYLRRMYTDTVSPHAMGVKFAVDFYGVDHVMYGSDYPCWNPTAALEVFAEAGLSAQGQEQILYSNARRILGLRDPQPSQVGQPARELAAV